MRLVRAGFTLVELLITVAIIGLLLTSASLPFNAWLRSDRLRKGQELLIGALREAQVRAFQDGKPWRLLVSSNGEYLYLEPAVDGFGTEPGCGNGGWSGTLQAQYALPKGIQVGLRSSDCIVYESNGRVASGNPWVQRPTPESGNQALMALTDGRRLDADLLKVVEYYSQGVASWYPSRSPVLEVDLREARFVERIELGLVARTSRKVIYPPHIVVFGTEKQSAQPGDWVLLYEADGPASPPGSTAVPATVSIPVGQVLHQIKIGLCTKTDLTKPSDLAACKSTQNYMTIDEIDFGNRFFTITDGQNQRTIEIDPTTGRVTVRGVK